MIRITFQIVVTAVFAQNPAVNHDVKQCGLKFLHVLLRRAEFVLVFGDCRVANVLGHVFRRCVNFQLQSFEQCFALFDYFLRFGLFVAGF